MADLVKKFLKSAYEVKNPANAWWRSALWAVPFAALSVGIFFVWRRRQRRITELEGKIETLKREAHFSREMAQVEDNMTRSSQYYLQSKAKEREAGELQEEVDSVIFDYLKDDVLVKSAEDWGLLKEVYESLY